MLKKSLLFCSVLFVGLSMVFVAPANAIAPETTQIQIHDVSGYTFYPLQLDAQVLDFTLVPHEGDFLNALTIKNSGLAYASYFERVILYEDDGNGQFDGWMIDTEVGEATYHDPSQTWYWNNLHVSVPATGKQFFVAVDIKRDLDITVNDRTVQMYIPAFYDVAGDYGTYDIGDLGVFMDSFVFNSEYMNYGNTSYQTIRKSSSDRLAPQSVIINPQDLENITDTDSYLIAGMLRDQGGSSPEWVQVGINGVWYTAEIINKEDDVYYWQYDWQNIDDGKYTLDTMSRDWIGNTEYDGHEIHVTKTQEPVADLDYSFEKVTKFSVTANGYDFAVLIYEVHDQNDQPLSGQTIDMDVDQTWVDVDKTSGITDANGQVQFVVTSTTVGSAIFSFYVNGQLTDNTAIISFVEPGAEDFIDYTDGRWVKRSDMTAVYFLDKENIRHAYPTQNVWDSYFGEDFSFVEIISAEEMAGYPIGRNVPFKTGSLMKMPSVPKVYAVEDNYVINWLVDEWTAQVLYGEDWASLIYDLPETFFTDYNEGEPMAVIY